MLTRRLLLLVLGLPALSTCARDPQETTSQQAAGDPQQGARAPLVVSIAASMGDVMNQLLPTFEAENQVAVKINLGASSSLANQILQGAPVDLFVSANAQWADELAEAGLVAEQVRMLTNRLVLVVPAANPENVHVPDDLRSPAVQKLALAGEKVPAGLYAGQVLKKLGLLDDLTSQHRIARGHDVRAALRYVERGEAEAGIVYSTDLRAANGVRAVYDFDPSLHDEIVYVLVRIKRPDENPAARVLFEHLQSAEADEVYRQYGFSRIDPDSPSR